MPIKGAPALDRADDRASELLASAEKISPAWIMLLASAPRSEKSNHEKAAASLW
jgi:hypothetical protein